MKPDISIIIRAFNEQTPLATLLKSLKSQEYDPEKVEIIVVDNGSTDKTAQIAKNYGAIVVTLTQDEFNYPRSSNLGISAARAPIVGLISAHAEPVEKTWISSSLKWFEDPEICGVWGPCCPHKNDSSAEKWLYGSEYLKMQRTRYKETNKPKLIGTFPAVSCCLRKDLWEQHHFDEQYGAGGEDTEWANFMIKKGFKVVCDVNLAVYHSHGLGWLGILKQYLYWFKIRNPHPILKEGLKYRGDMVHDTVEKPNKY